MSDQSILIYAVDDEPYVVHLWYQFEADNTFPGVVYDGSSSADGALEFLRGLGSSRPKTLFVLDSRMPLGSKTFDAIHRKLLSEMRIDVGTWREDPLLCGPLLAAYIKLLLPEARIVLLTGFANELQKRRDDPTVDLVLVKCASQMLPKPCSESRLIQVLRKELEELRKAS